MNKESHNVEIRVFAGLREGIGSEWACVECPLECTAADVKLALQRQHPQVADLVRVSRLAMGHAFVDDGARLEFQSCGGLNLALIPPVSGG